MSIEILPPSRGLMRIKHGNDVFHLRYAKCDHVIRITHDDCTFPVIEVPAKYPVGDHGRLRRGTFYSTVRRAMQLLPECAETIDAALTSMKLCEMRRRLMKDGAIAKPTEKQYQEV